MFRKATYITYIYVENPINKMKILYQKQNNNIQEKKAKVICKTNENKKHLPRLPERVYIKNRQKQQENYKHIQILKKLMKI